MGSDTFFSREDLENFVFTTFSTGDIGGLDPQAMLMSSANCRSQGRTSSDHAQRHKDEHNMGKSSVMIMKICIHVADSLCYTAGGEGDDRG